MRHLEDSRAILFTAVQCSNSSLPYGTCEVFRELGQSVPSPLRVIYFHENALENCQKHKLPGKVDRTMDEVGSRTYLTRAASAPLE